MSKTDQIEYVHVGKILDAHGIRGDIYALIFSGDNSWGDKLERVQLRRGEDSQTFDVEKVKPFKKGFILKLKGFQDRNRAEEFKSAELWIEQDIFVSEEGEHLYLREVLNFTVNDEQQGNIGEVLGFSSNGIQDLLVVQHNGFTYEIPFVEDFVLDIDYENKKLLMKLPEGLLEINRDN